LAGEELAGTKQALGAILFMQATMNTLDGYSTLLSSPWTAESFGADERRAKALQEYLAHAVTFSMAYAVASALIVRGRLGWYIIAGAVSTNLYLIWLYTRASKRGRAAGASDWANGN
jgi:hypothetical protein